MYIALRELRAAWGRFVMIGVVVALVATLVGMVSGFTIGLGKDTVSALRAMNASSIAFATGTSDFNRSVVSAADVEKWESRDGVTVAPVGISMTHGESTRDVAVDMTVIGVEPGSSLSPSVEDGSDLGVGPGEVVISSGLRNEGITVGDEIVVENTDTRLHVVGVTGSRSYGHVDAAYTSLDTWREIRYGSVDLTAHQQGTVSAVVIFDGDAPAELGSTTVNDEGTMLAAAPGYEGERLTMNSILVFLYIISPLIVAAFFSVWVLQRQGVYALQRAMGVSRRSLIGAALAQAVTVVVVATVIGSAVAYGFGVLLGQQVPFDLPISSLATTTIAVIAASLIGAAVTLRWVVSADPLTMLGAAR